MAKKISVFGCGNMVQAIFWNFKNQADFYFYTPSLTRAKVMADRLKGTVLESIDQTPESDMIILGCKPQQFEHLSSKLKEYVTEKTVVISLLAGIPVHKIQEGLGSSLVVRTMPNTPCLISKGATTIYYDPAVPQKVREDVSLLFKEVSEVYCVDTENQLDYLAPFNGSGPAYIFELARILTLKAQSQIPDKKLCDRLVKQTILGAAELLYQSGDTPEVLRDKVTSKRGITYEALQVLEKNHLQTIFDGAIDSAYERGKELSRQ